MFAPPPTQPASIVNTTDQTQRRVDEELDRWKDDPATVKRTNGVPESVLSFWAKVEHDRSYTLLPKAAKFLYAIPISSCQIERDFGVSGQKVTTQHTSLSDHNNDMCSFLNRNREYVDLLQREKIPSGGHSKHTPSCFSDPLDVDLNLDLFADGMLATFDLYEDEEEKEN
ncbi:hypothetical protein V7S43_000909 [Phytophthora oleae]|uniref:HAT C-terminal dimerisation domain-containing protein n=1 Tax=Phytophthora oleae TaxID=2107226 RepID=A0ABD3G944_9STRA